jgi:hypothetical protein
LNADKKISGLKLRTKKQKSFAGPLYDARKQERQYKIISESPTADHLPVRQPAQKKSRI